MTDTPDSAIYSEGEPFNAEGWLTDFEQSGGRCYLDPATEEMTIHIIVMGHSEAQRQRARELYGALLNASDSGKRIAAVEAALKVRCAPQYEEKWPDIPEVASFLALCYRRLGGFFTVTSNGHRMMGQPESSLYDRLSMVPQLPKAVHRDRFQSEAEWAGAMKLLSYSLAHLSDADRELVFGAFAPIAIDARKQFDFREQLQ